MSYHLKVFVLFLALVAILLGNFGGGPYGEHSCEITFEFEPVIQAKLKIKEKLHIADTGQGRSQKLTMSLAPVS